MCKHLHLFPAESKIQVLPINDEKYISLSIGIRVASYTDRRGVEKHVYEYVRFVDSLRFMASSLDKLLGYLPAENFSFLDNHVPQHCSVDLQLLHQKGFYPYSYFASHEKFQDKSLPSIEKWTNFLQDGQVSIQRTFNMQQKFSKSLGAKTSVVTTTFT